MTAQDVHDFLRGHDAGWVDWPNSVDTFKAGDPGSEVRGIAVGWKAHRHSLERADELGCNLFVCHEPLFYDHHDMSALSWGGAISYRYDWKTGGRWTPEAPVPCAICEQATGTVEAEWDHEPVLVCHIAAPLLPRPSTREVLSPRGQSS